MIPVLRQLLYMIDRWRESSVVWGVGRGSSVSSFVLYLIGINRINPRRFGLDASEFFK
jgi:DNA polymerase III alpha subunit